jgi:hypothetical protein
MHMLMVGVRWLVLPLAVLLWAQWPLRSALQAYSREANDLAQILFALYVAVAVTAASRQGAHLRAGAGTHHSSRWRAWATVACVAPWSVFALWSMAPGVWQSLAEFEHFPESLNPGYFVLRIALFILHVLVLVQAIAGASAGEPLALGPNRAMGG